MPTVPSSDGVELAVEIVGSGEPITLLAHGLTGSRRELELFPPFLPGTKVLFDFRGHGESGRPPPESYSMDHFAGDLEAVADAFEATAVAGVSLGGGATLRLLRRRPDRFSRLVFLLPARLERATEAHTRLLRTADLLESEGPEEAARIVVAEEAARGAFEAFPTSRAYRLEAIRRMNSDGIPHAIRELLNDAAPSDEAALRRVTAPSLVVGQEGDPVHTADVARELAEWLPNSELVILPDQYSLIREIPTLVQKVTALLLS